MKLSIEKFKKYVDDEFSLEQLEALADVVNDRLITIKTAIDKANHKTIKGFSINEQAEAEAYIYESLRDWFKKEKWVRISSSGKIAGKCGTSKNKKNPDRCLPLAKARSLSKGQRAATAAKKKKAGAKGKTVVKNTKKATVKKENLQVENVNNYVNKIFGTVEKAGQKLLDTVSRETKQTIYALKEIAEMVVKREKPSPAELKKIVEQLKDFGFLGALVLKDKFLIFAILYYIIDKSNIADELLKLNETSDPQDGKAAPYGSGFKPVKMKKETKEAPAGHYFTKSGNLVKGRMSKDAKERGARKSDPKDKMRSKVPKVTQYAEITKEDIRNLVVGTIAEMKNENILTEKDDRCTRLAKQKYDTWPSAYASGAVVRCRRGEIWKKK